MTMNPSSLLLGGHARTGGPVSCGDCPVVTNGGSTPVVGRDFRLPCSDSDGDVLCAEGHD